MSTVWDPVSLATLQQVKLWVEQQVKCYDRPFMLGVGGPGGSGKSRVTDWLRWNVANLTVLSLDDFRLPRGERPAHALFGSHPDAIDWNRLKAVLREAKAGGSVRQPIFDRKTGRATRERVLPGGDVILLDGEITAYERMFPFLDKRMMVEAHLWTQLKTRLIRDRGERRSSFKKTVHIFYRSNLRDYPGFVSDSPPDIRLYRTFDHQLLFKSAERQPAATAKSSPHERLFVDP